MARKSRKDQIRAANSGQALSEQRQTAAPAEKTYATVGYARLSILETRDRKDSEALQNQKALIREYIQSQGDLTLLSIYEDNGETGTNFQRPGFEAMMEAICAGKANCIVVKDLSRFGRNYIEAGNYLEHVFPAMGVRFISIGDGYDSAEKIGGRQQCRHCPLAEQFRDFVPLLLPVPERHPDRPAVRPAQALEGGNGKEYPAQPSLPGPYGTGPPSLGVLRRDTGPAPAEVGMDHCGEYP